MLYHHTISLEGIIFGEVKGNPKHTNDIYFEGAYKWIEKEVGFYPLFLAVGKDEDSIRMTGYEDNWRSVVREWTEHGKRKTERRKAGEFPNHVLFSFDDVDGVFTDYDAWHLVLNSQYNNYQLTDHEKRQVFKYSWRKSDWLRKAKKDKGSVQLVAPKLYLPDASRIWVRNKKTKRLLEGKGFEGVKVRRLLLLKD